MIARIPLAKTVLFVGFFLVLSFFALAALPSRAHAQGNAAAGANASCNPVDKRCMCGMKFDPQYGCIPGANRFMCECEATVNGQPTTGKCVEAGHCKAEKSSGSPVDSALQQLGQMLGQALQKLMSGGGGGGGGGGMPPGGGAGLGGQGLDRGFGQQPCTTPYQVSAPSSDPCAVYVPPVADDLNNALNNGSAANDLLNSLNSTGNANNNVASNPGTASNVGGETGDINTGNINGGTQGGASGIIDTTGGSAHTGAANNGVSVRTQSSQQRQNSLIGLITNPANLNLASTTAAGEANRGTATTTGYSFFGTEITVPAGINPNSPDFASFTTIANLIAGNPNGSPGDLQLGGNGATISSSNQDTRTNTAVSGFIGANATSGAGSQGVAAWMCRTRPWAGSIFSRIIPDSFFDSLCVRRGYQLGQPPPSKASAPVLTQTPVRARKSAPATAAKPVASTTPAVPPKVQIWAVPATVSIGSRTSVFWSTRGVASCTETSPDGSFNQNSLSGGASTVPLTAATTYTISCLTPDGTPVTDFFTVKMAI